MRYNNLNAPVFPLMEGVKYGEKEKQWVFGNLDRFRIGIEVELRATPVDVSNIDIAAYDDNNVSLTALSKVTKKEVSELIGNLASSAVDQYSNNTAVSSNPLVDGMNPFIVSLLLMEGGLPGFDHIQTPRDFYRVMETVWSLYQSKSGVESFNDFRKIIKDTITACDELPLMNELIDQYDVILNEMMTAIDELHSYVTDNTLISFEQLRDYTQIQNAFNDLHESLLSLDRDIVDDYTSTISGSMREFTNDYLLFNSDELSLPEAHELVYIEASVSIVDILDELSLDAHVLPTIYNIPTDSLMHHHIALIKDIQQDLNKNFTTKFDVVDEHDYQIELITTDVITGENIIKSFDETFKVIDYLCDKYPLETSDYSGLHVSISMLNTSKTPDIGKFLILSNILNLIPTKASYVRSLVTDLNAVLRHGFPILLERLKKDLGGSWSSAYLNSVELWLRDVVSIDKLQTVSFQDMNVHKGRIEIRMFGGKGYEKQKDTVWNTTIRSLYALSLAHDRNLQRNEYLKTIFSVMNRVSNDVIGMDISTYLSNTSKLVTILRRATDQDNMTLPVGKSESYYHKVIDLVGTLGNFDDDVSTQMKKSVVEIGNGRYMVRPDESLIKLLQRQTSVKISESLELMESNGMKLKDIVDVQIGNKDADFYLVRRGGIDDVGKPSKEFLEYGFGITITRPDIIDPNYLFYAMHFIYTSGYWKGKAKGSLRLVSIRKEDVLNVPLGS